jgi:hypothetical protein
MLLGRPRVSGAGVWLQKLDPYQFIPISSMINYGWEVGLKIILHTCVRAHRRLRAPRASRDAEPGTDFTPSARGVDVGARRRGNSQWMISIFTRVDGGAASGSLQPWHWPSQIDVSRALLISAGATGA